MKKITLIALTFFISFSSYADNDKKLILLCSGEEIGSKTYLDSGKKNSIENKITNKTYNFEKLLDFKMDCNFSKQTIYCTRKIDGFVMSNVYLIADYSISIDRHSGNIDDFTSELMNDNGTKTKLVKKFTGVCTKSQNRKF